MLPLKERMKFLRKELGLSQQDISDTLGCKVGKIKQIESGSTATISFADAKLLKQKYRINDEWIRFGNGEVFTNLTIDDLMTLEKDLIDLPFFSIPYYENISLFKKNKNNHNNYIVIPKEHLSEDGNLSACVVDGDCMSPTVNKNDLLIINSDKIEFIDGKIFIVKYEDSFYAKRIFRMPKNRVILKCDNLNYPDINIDINELDIIAQVVYSINFKNLV